MKIDSLKSALTLFPLFVLYILVAVIFSHDHLIGDELRHIHYAINLSEGFFSDPDRPELLTGPGYPSFLVPFVMLGIPLIAAKVVNALLVFTAIFYFKKTLDLFSNRKSNMVFIYALGLYPPLVRWIPYLYSESLAVFLMCALIFHFSKLVRYKKLNTTHLIIASFYLGILILVKVIFLQVVMVSLLLLGVFLFKKSKKERMQKTSFLLLGSFLWIAPYLFYAFQLTQKPFYLGTIGGEILYHRATPYENEWGNWFSADDILKGQNPDYRPNEVYEDLGTLSENHRPTFAQLEPLTPVEKDSALKAIALANVKAHPIKYLKNTAANLGRLLFHYPFSYREQNMSAYGYMIPNMFIIVLLLLSTIPFVLFRKYVRFELKAIMAFTLIYAFGILLLDGRGRNFIIMVPSFLLFISYMYTHFLKITLIKES